MADQKGKFEEPAGKPVPIPVDEKPAQQLQRFRKVARFSTTTITLSDGSPLQGLTGEIPLKEAEELRDRGLIEFVD